ncbi:MAG: hypothetical protein NC301_03445 [Bacteroides sp.]|nr:hypothetical protein [Bacteroides sp.]MCM1379189.1 hypothetical protein [Bacteroides sp.]MCM1445162.1 hypothetical protein [Prevotella sp.]
MRSCLKYLLLALIPALAACKGTEPDGPQTAVASIVTYESTVDGETTFTYTDNNEDLITLTANWGGNSDLAAGNRTLIYYVADEYGVSGPISLLSVTRLPGGAPKFCAADARLPQSEPMTQTSIWRSGTYLNLSSMVSFPGNATEVALYVDESTKDDPYPTARIIVSADYVGLGVQRALYASWDISSLLSAPGCQGLTVIYNTSEQIVINN